MNDKNGEPPTPIELALTCLLVTLEERDPGLVDDWVRHAESDALRSEVHRLHVKSPSPTLVANLHEAKEIAVRARFVVRAHVRPRRKGRG